MTSANDGLPYKKPDTDMASEGVRITLPGDASKQERWLWRGLILVLCLLIYVPAMFGGFIWDDPRHANASTNANLNMRDFNGLVNIWTALGQENGGTPQYYPLTHTTYWLEYHIWGKNPIGYHAVNIALHAASAMLLWELLRKLRVPGAFLAALVFAVHPMMAESVAWTTERKNTLSLLLVFTSLLMYLRFAAIGENDAEEAELRSRPDDWNLYTFALLAFIGAMLSKTVAASTPVALIGILWWKGKLTPRHLGLIAPMLVVAIGLGALTAYVEHRYVIRGENTVSSFGAFLSAKLSGTLNNGQEFELPFAKRLLMAGMVPWFYLWKIIWPGELLFFYPRWDLINAEAWWWIGLLGLVALLGLTVVLAAKGKRWPLVALVAFLAALFPAMGFVDVYPFRYSYVADHFAYHAAWIAITVLCAGIAVAARRIHALADSRVMIGAGAVLALALAARTWVHAADFVDNIALFEHTLTGNPNAFAATMNLGAEYLANGEKALAIKRQAVRSGDTVLAKQASDEAAVWLGKARQMLNRTLELKPDHEWAHFNLGKLAADEDKADEALAMFLKSAEVRIGDKDSRNGPYAPTFTNIGDLLAARGDYKGAIENYRKAISLENPPFQPKDPGTRLSLLRLSMRQYSPTTRPTTQQSQDMVKLADEATKLLPRSEMAWLAAGDLMRDLGARRDAVAAYREAVSINPGNTDALFRLGLAMAELGDYDTARFAFAEALRLNPAREDVKHAMELSEKLRAEATTRAATRAATRPTTQGATTRP